MYQGCKPCKREIEEPAKKITFFTQVVLALSEFSHFEEYLEKKSGEIQIYGAMNTDYIRKSHKRRHSINPLNAELNPTCHLLAALGAHHILQVSRIRVKHRIVQQYINARKFIFVASTYKNVTFSIPTHFSLLQLHSILTS